MSPGVVYDPVAMWQEMSIAAKCGVIIAYIATASIPRGLSTAGVTLLAYRDYLELEESVWATLKPIRVRLFSVVILSFLIGCATVLGLPFILPAMLVEMLTIFAVPVLLLERCGIAAALRRSVQLAWQRMGTILTLLLSLMIVVIVGEVFLIAFLRATDFGESSLFVTFWGVLAIAAPLLVSVYGTFVTVLYYDILVSHSEVLSPTPRFSR